MLPTIEIEVVEPRARQSIHDDVEAAISRNGMAAWSMMSGGWRDCDSSKLRESQSLAGPYLSLKRTHHADAESSNHREDLVDGE
jgi:hypothetical protein